MSLEQHVLNVEELQKQLAEMLEDIKRYAQRHQRPDSNFSLAELNVIIAKLMRIQQVFEAVSPLLERHKALLDQQGELIRAKRDAERECRQKFSNRNGDVRGSALPDFNEAIAAELNLSAHDQKLWREAYIEQRRDDLRADLPFVGRDVDKIKQAKAMLSACYETRYQELGQLVIESEDANTVNQNQLRQIVTIQKQIEDAKSATALLINSFQERVPAAKQSDELIRERREAFAAETNARQNALLAASNAEPQPAHTASSIDEQTGKPLILGNPDQSPSKITRALDSLGSALTSMGKWLRSMHEKIGVPIVDAIKSALRRKPSVELELREPNLYSESAPAATPVDHVQQSRRLTSHA